jgi:hypothetical protein
LQAHGIAWGEVVVVMLVALLVLLVLLLAGGGGTIGVNPNARAMKDAIWSRRTRLCGQKSVPASLHPNVTPDSAIALMFGSCSPTTSSNVSPGMGLRSKARARNDAI